MIDELFRRESAHLIAALVRLLGPSHLALAEDVVQEALASAVQAWRFEAPRDPKGWLLQVAKNRALDVLRRERRLQALTHQLDGVFAAEADDRNQLAMMLACCDAALSSETHVTLILRWLCGLSAAEIARAFLLDVQSVERRLHRGRSRLQALGQLHEPSELDVRRAQGSLERALYLLFNAGYQSSDPEHALHPALCADALRLTELLLTAPGVNARELHALAALFCMNAARLPARLDAEGVLVPLAEQDRTRWDRTLFERGVQHLSASASGEAFSRWHLEAAIAYEHTHAPTFAATDWPRIAQYYSALMRLCPGPVIALNQALALAETEGLAAGRAALKTLAEEPRLARYSFYWAACADLERRAGCHEQARASYARAIALAHSRAERLAYERHLQKLADG